VGGGAATTRHAFAAPPRLGSIWAHDFHYLLEGTGPAPLPHAPAPDAARVGRASSGFDDGFTWCGRWARAPGRPGTGCRRVGGL